MRRSPPPSTRRRRAARAHRARPRAPPRPRRCRRSGWRARRPGRRGPRPARRRGGPGRGGRGPGRSPAVRWRARGGRHRGTNTTRVPGGSSAGCVARLVPQRRVGAPEQPPPARRRGRVDPAPAAGQPDRAGRHPRTRRLQPGYGELRRQPGQVGEAGGEAAEGRDVLDLAVPGDDTGRRRSPTRRPRTPGPARRTRPAPRPGHPRASRPTASTRAVGRRARPGRRPRRRARSAPPGTTSTASMSTERAQVARSSASTASATSARSADRPTRWRLHAPSLVQVAPGEFTQTSHARRCARRRTWRPWKWMRGPRWYERQGPLASTGSVTSGRPDARLDPARPVTGPAPRVASRCGSWFLSDPQLPVAGDLVRRVLRGPGHLPQGVAAEIPLVPQRRPQLRAGHPQQACALHRSRSRPVDAAGRIR